jgi:ligand-binding SRPBCC domain-containing protein
MRVRELKSELWLPRPRDEVFAFFSDAANLDLITPPWLSFHTVTDGPIHMQAGTLIDYKMRIRGVPIRWRTKITAWEPPRRFVDEQPRGPYRLWMHEHAFEQRDGGTVVHDQVRFAVFLDFIVYPMLVRRDVDRIFAYRAEKSREEFAIRN